MSKVGGQRKLEAGPVNSVLQNEFVAANGQDAYLPFDSDSFSQTDLFADPPCMLETFSASAGTERRLFLLARRRFTLVERFQSCRVKVFSA